MYPSLPKAHAGQPSPDAARSVVVRCRLRTAPESIGFALAGYLGIMTACAAAIAGDPVKIELRGTRIDILPDSVELLVEDPSRAAEEFIKKGGLRIFPDVSAATLIEYRRIIYRFSKPSNWNRHNQAHRFNDGDVIYVFRRDSIREADALTSKYDLSKLGPFRADDDKKLQLLRASDAHFVVILVKKRLFYCPMDREQTSERQGNCPVCGMPFVETFEYH